MVVLSVVADYIKCYHITMNPTCARTGCDNEVSTTKNPGAPKKYCSEQCRDSAKNARARNKPHRCSRKGCGAIVTTKASTCSVHKKEEGWAAAGIDLTYEQFEIMFSKQQSKCLFCGSLDGGTRGWVPDHDHKTGRVRSIVCSDCNLNLISNHTLQSARELVKYLENYAPGI